MRISDTCARNAASLAPMVVAALTATAVAQQPSPDLDTLLARVGEQVERYYSRAQNLICTERVTAQPVGFDSTPNGFARVLEYELHVESDAGVDGGSPKDVKVVRDLRRVNGRVVKTVPDRRDCFDPNPLSPEPLAFLLAANRKEYAFTWAGFGKGREQNLMQIDYRPLETGKPKLVEAPDAKPGCFNISLPGGTKGRIWVEVGTHDIVRMEEHLAHPVDVPIDNEQQRRHNLPDRLVIDRYDYQIRYKPVSFDDPRETLLLPDSIDMLAMFRGAQSHRKRQVFTDYKRFMTAGRVVKD
ncbi:MAG TPA: hypothetical protein VH497_21120 [Vicinamibacterales bacterium]|jgi:hypothetical protein